MTYAVARRQQKNVLGMQIPCSKYAAGYAADLAGYVTIPAKLAVYLNRFVLTGYIATGNYTCKYSVVNMLQAIFPTTAQLDSLQGILPLPICDYRVYCICKYPIKMLQVCHKLQHSFSIYRVCCSYWKFVITGYTAVSKCPHARYVCHKLQLCGIITGYTAVL